MNDRGQLGVEDADRHGAVAHIFSVHDVREVLAEDIHTCALQNSGDVYCWGDNRYGAIGREPFGTFIDDVGAQRGYKYRTPQRVEGLSDIVHIAASVLTVCALDASGQLYCWGDDWTGLMRLPSEDGTSPNVAHPVAIPEADDVVDFDMHFNHGCLIRRSGEVACWGSDYHGAIGPEPSHVPFGHLQVVRGLPSH